MEEKKFPWLLRLLSVNSCNLQLLETYAVYKEKVIASFVNDFNHNIIQTNGKNLPFNTLDKCLDYIKTQQSYTIKSQIIRHTFFRYKGKVDEISPDLLLAFSKRKKPIPMVSYIQVARSSFMRFATWVVQLNKSELRGNMFPACNNLTILAKAKEISRMIISLIESHENKKVSKIVFEFLIDKSLKLTLSHMSSCILIGKERQELFYSASARKSKLLEISEIVNELSSPCKVVKRKRSKIRKIVQKENPSVDKLSSSMTSNSLESLQESDESLSEENLNYNPQVSEHDNFIELICGTRIKQRLGPQTLYVSDEELESEKNSVFEIIEGALKTKNQCKEIFQRNSFIYRKYFSKQSIMSLFPSDSLKIPHSKRSSSYFDLLPMINKSKRNTMICKLSNSSKYLS